MKHITIGGVETFSTVDFPNMMAAVVFMQGCPWRCPFCHNKALQKIGAESSFIWEKFFEFLQSRKGILDAVVFSGGEPLVQDELKDQIEEVKSLGYKIGLHTGGYRPEALAKVLSLVDWVGFDIKAPLNAEHYQKAIGGINHFDKAMESLQMILDSGISFECRTTCDPRILSVEDIYTIADELKAKGVKEYYLQKYRQVEGDDTPDSECDKFFEDKKLLEYLQSTFEIFDIRK